MSERIIEQQRESVAKWIMGFEEWQTEGRVYWRTPDRIWAQGKEYWTPDDDLSDAMAVAEALRQKGYTVRLTTWPQTEYPYNCTIWDKFGIETAVTSVALEQAIFQAAVQVAERLEKERE